MRSSCRISLVALFAGLTITLLPAVASGQEIIRLTAIDGYPPKALWVKILSNYYLPEVNRRLAKTGNYRIEWTEAYGGTVAKIGGVLEAIEEGLVDMGFVGTIFEAPKMPLQNVSYVSPFGTEDIGVVTGAIAKLQRDIPAMAKS